MYKYSPNTKGASFMSLVRAITYSYLAPRTGFYKALRDRFGTSSLLMLIVESAIFASLKFLPNRQPGMAVAVEVRYGRRFKRIIERLGLKVKEYESVIDLMRVCEDKSVFAVIVPDKYEDLTAKYRNILEKSSVNKIFYQNRIKPTNPVPGYTFYIWQPKKLPKSMTGAVISLLDQKQLQTYLDIKQEQGTFPRISNSKFIKEIYKSWRSLENTYRRLDRRPPKVLSRLLYDMYK